jgi:hypothetical protein
MLFQTGLFLQQPSENTHHLNNTKQMAASKLGNDFVSVMLIHQHCIMIPPNHAYHNSTIQTAHLNDHNILCIHLYIYTHGCPRIR